MPFRPFPLSQEKGNIMFKKIAAAAALVAASSAVFAAEPAPFYAGVDVSSTKVSGYDDEGGYGAFIGYKINQNVAVEAGFHRLADTDIDGADVTLDQTSVSLIGSLPLADGFSLYTRIGYNRVEGEISSGGYKDKDHTNNALYGIGMGYAFSPVVSGRVEVQKPDSAITKLVAGVAFRF
jgi:OOP family OmpA-OmpF porin